MTTRMSTKASCRLVSPSKSSPPPCSSGIHDCCLLVPAPMFLVVCSLYQIGYERFRGWINSVSSGNVVARCVDLWCYGSSGLLRIRWVALVQMMVMGIERTEKMLLRGDAHVRRCTWPAPQWSINFM